MRTSELPPGAVIKFKNQARIQLFYERWDRNWSDIGGSMLAIDVRPGDIMTIMKTAKKDMHVGQTVFINGVPKVLYYQVDSFFDMNKGVIGQVDLTVGDFYYDVLEMKEQ